LYRFDPRRIGTGESPLKLDSPAPKIELEKYIYNETRYKMLQKMNPERAKMLLASAQKEVKARYAIYEAMAKMSYTNDNGGQQA
jgi:pyruvate-ferredoxin/flavodoxin oxidoreductase